MNITHDPFVCEIKKEESARTWKRLSDDISLMHHWREFPDEKICHIRQSLKIQNLIIDSKVEEYPADLLIKFVIANQIRLKKEFAEDVMS